MEKFIFVWFVLVVIVSFLFFGSSLVKDGFWVGYLLLSVAVYIAVITRTNW